MRQPLRLLLFLVLVTVLHAQEKERLNVVLFLIDDLGWQDTEVPFGAVPTEFNNRYRTPAMARLAKMSVVFTDAYAASCVCTPTRVSIMTGQNPARHRITNWILRKGVDQSAKHPVLRSPKGWNTDGLNASSVTLPRLLQAAGYRTIHVGKAHWGSIGTSGADPCNLGFDVNIAGHAAGAPGSYFGLHNFSNSLRRNKTTTPSVWDVPGLQKYHGKDIHLSEALTREAKSAVTAAVKSGQPFFLNFAHYAVHTPIMPDKRFVDHYSELDAKEAAYASMIEGYDRSLGDLMDHLRKLKVSRNTVICFMSDNGGLSAHARGGKRHSHNAPLASGKGSALEGGIRVPMMIAWPGVTTKTVRCSTPVISDDLFPTLCALAGVPIPPAHKDQIDGMDLSPLMTKEAHDLSAFAERTLGFHYPHKWGGNGPGIQPFSAIRRGRYKLIHYYPGGSNALFDLQTDLSETNNLASKRPKLLKDMLAHLRAYLLHTQAQLPVVKATGRAAPLP